MTLQLTSQWEHDIFGADNEKSHLVVTIKADESTPGNRAPIDLAFALDRSGSMSGQNKLELVKQAVLTAVDQLQESDRVSLVTFDDEVQVRHNLTPVDHDHRRHLERVTHAIQVGGSTNLSGGWLEACRELSHIPEGTPRVRRALLLTDGMANVGITNPGELAKHARELRDRGISTSAIGVGAGFDEFLLSNMAESGGGNFQYIAHPSELERFFSDEISSLADTVAMNPYLEVTVPHGSHANLVNSFPSESHNRHTSVDLRDLAAGDEVHLVFEVTSPRGSRGEIVPELHLHWTNPQTGAVDELNLAGTSIAFGDASMAVRNDAAAEIVALELTARDNRKAVELDRQGRYHDSRELLRYSAARLQAAPATEGVRNSMRMAEDMATMAEDQPMSEHDRKSRVYEAHSRSRGSRRSHEERPRRVSGGDHCHVTKREVRYEFFRDAGEAARGEGRRHFGERHHDEAESPRFERRPHRCGNRTHVRRFEMFREAGETMRGEGRRHFGERRHDEAEFGPRGGQPDESRRHRHGAPRRDRSRRNV